MNLSLANVSNFLVGSNELKLSPFYIQSFTVPQVTRTNIQQSVRSGLKLSLNGDSMDFDKLNLDILLDSKFDTYFELLDAFFKGMDFRNDTFSNFDFNIWVQCLDSSKNELFRFDFWNCKIDSISQIDFSSELELGSKFQVALTYDYFTFYRNDNSETLDGRECTEPERKRFYDNHPYPLDKNDYLTQRDVKK